MGVWRAELPPELPAFSQQNQHCILIGDVKSLRDRFNDPWDVSGKAGVPHPTPPERAILTVGTLECALAEIQSAVAVI